MADWKIREIKEPPVPQQKGEPKEAFERRIGEELGHKLVLLLDHYKIPRGDPEAGWKLAFALAEEHNSGFRPKKATGVKHNPEDSKRDLVLIFSVFIAERKNPDAKILPTIRTVAKDMGWPTDDATISTLRRRYYLLLKKDSNEQRQLIEDFAKMPLKI